MTILPFILAAQAVSLTWTPTPGTTSNVTRNGAVIATGLTTGTYKDSTVHPGSFYSYFVTATNKNGTSTSSNVITLTIPTTPSQTWTCTSTATVTGTALTITNFACTAK